MLGWALTAIGLLQVYPLVYLAVRALLVPVLTRRVREIT